MFNFSKMSFTQKLTVPIAGMGLLVLGSIAAFTTWSSIEAAHQAANARGIEVGQRSSGLIKADIDRAFHQAALLGRSFVTEIEDKKQDRARMRDILESFLKSEPSYFAIWTAFEPNAYDGRDSEFVNKEFHESSGRVYPWWVRKGSEYRYDTVLNPETPELLEWYNDPFKSRKSMIIDPYVEPVDGEDVVMTSVTYPMVLNSQAIGVVGIDIGLGEIKKIVGNIKPYSDSLSYLVSNKNIVVAGPDASEVMKEYDAPVEIKNAIEKNSLSILEVETTRGAEQVIVVPVPIYKDGQYWYLVIQTPQATILAPAWNNLYLQLILSVIGQIGLLSVVFIGARKSEKKISDISLGLDNAAKEIVTSVEDLTETGSGLAGDSIKAAASIEETAAAIEEITAITSQNSVSAQSAAVLSNESSQWAELSEKGIADLSGVMQNISTSSKKIEEIINIIDEIAFQTNLLALNASVEAARAGEHGRGFAVVADAVRSLALRSAAAAKDINELISASADTIKKGSATVAENESILHKVVESVRKVSILNGEIAEASKQQAEGILQINTAITALDSSIQKNAREAQLIVSNAEKILENSQAMQETVKVLTG